MTFEDGDGRRSTLRERRFVSLIDMHLAGLEIRLAFGDEAVAFRSGEERVFDLT
jgi:hypothetical protein